MYTLEFLLKKMIDPGEDYSSDEKPVLKVDHFSQIYQLVSSEIVE